MGGDPPDVTVSGAKDASGNIIFPLFSERHMSISLPPSSGLSPAAEDVTTAYIRLLQRRDDERDNELAALRAEVAQMKQHLQVVMPAASRSTRGGRRRRRSSHPPSPPSPLPPPPPLREQPNKAKHRVSAKNRLGFTPEKGDARELILYKRPTTSRTHRSKSHREWTHKRDTKSFTSTYSIGRAKFSRTMASRQSRDSVETRRHVSERLGGIPPENLDNETYVWQNGKGVRIDGVENGNKKYDDREKSVDHHHRATTDLRDKLRSRVREKTFEREKDPKQMRMDELSKPPRLGFERQLKDLGISPFTSHIVNTVPEPNFHLPKFTKFHPSTCEAYTHLIHFRQTIKLCTTKDEIKCKAFPSSLGSHF